MNDVVSSKRILIVGNPDAIHVGAHLRHAAKSLKLNVRFCDTKEAYKSSTWLQKYNWWFRGHRPVHLRAFSDQIIRACMEFRPSWMVCTGIAPIDHRALSSVGELGVQRLIYLTDDPWNSVHFAPWFMKALPLYDKVFSTRLANLDDLQRSTGATVSYLPFAYAPEIHYPEEPGTPEENLRFLADIVFVGGADRDRVPYLVALARAGFNLAIYGGYWERYSDTKKFGLGHADPSTVRKALHGAKVALCLVRRANRDGSCMRTFEVPAIGACMLVEDTREQREIFGDDGKAVLYFSTVSEMVKRARWLLDHDEERSRLAQAVHRLIVDGGHTYRDRLKSMLELSQSSAGQYAPAVN